MLGLKLIHISTKGHLWFAMIKDYQHTKFNICRYLMGYFFHSLCPELSLNTFLAGLTDWNQPPPSLQTRSNVCSKVWWDFISVWLNYHLEDVYGTYTVYGKYTENSHKVNMWLTSCPTDWIVVMLGWYSHFVRIFNEWCNLKDNVCCHLRQVLSIYHMAKHTLHIPSISTECQSKRLN